MRNDNARNTDDTRVMTLDFSKPVGTLLLTPLYQCAECGDPIDATRARDYHYRCGSCTVQAVRDQEAEAEAAYNEDRARAWADSNWSDVDGNDSEEEGER